MIGVLSIDLSKDCVSPVFPAPNLATRDRSVPAARGRKDQKSRLSADNLNAGCEATESRSGPYCAGMNRRDFITLVPVLRLAWPVAAFAQDSTKIYRIFWVSTQSQPDPFLDGFREGMRALGYVEGKNVDLRIALYARQSAGAARSGGRTQARQYRPCRVERTRDPRDDGGQGRSGPVCAERRPRGIGLGPESRKTRRQFHRLDLPFPRAGGQAG